MVLLLILIAPIIQIVLSVLCITGKVQLPLVTSWVIANALGVLLSIQAENLVIVATPPGRVHCEEVSVAITFGGIFITIFSTAFIGIISYLVYRYKSAPSSPK